MNALKEMKRASLVFCLSVAACGSLLIAVAEPPRVKVDLVATNATMLSITIINATSNTGYDLWRRQLLDQADPWTLHVTGMTNQTNFLVEMGIHFIGFFDVTSNDLDGDGVLNFRDGQLTDSNIGTLTVTIETPADGATIQ